MTFEIGLVIAILLSAIVMFATEKFRPDIVAIMVMSALAVTNLVTPTEAFSGFANPAVVTVVAIFVISEGLFQTGVADFLAIRILKVSRSSETRLLIILMLTVGVLSAFINNVGSTAVFLPAVLIIARRAKIKPSKLLIPLAFAAAMGGNLTLIGTPPNILASAILQEHPDCLSFSFNSGSSCEGLGFFDFAPMGILILIFGTLYMAFIGRHILPDYDTHTDLTKHYDIHQYLSEIRVLPISPLVDKTVIESRFGKDYDLTIIGIIRNGKDRLAVRRNDHIRANDILLVEGSLDKILKVREQQGLNIEMEVEYQPDTDLESHEAGVAELILDVGSSLTGQTIKQINFREKYRLSVLALRRPGRSITNTVRNEPLQQGDILLVQGRRSYINALHRSHNFLLLAPISISMRRTKKAKVALAILIIMLITVTTGWLHVSVAAMIAALFMIISGVLKVDEAYASIDWQSVFLIAGMLPLGIAMETSEAAKLLANLITEWMSIFGPIGILAGLYIMSGLMTQVMSNAATTVLLAPIAINVAISLGADPRSFLMAIVVASNASFLTPIAHQSNILVFGVGGYKFTDFTKVGAGLTVLYFILIIAVLPFFWPLF